MEHVKTSVDMWNSVQKDITVRAADLLGGVKTFREVPISSMDWVCLIRKGFPILALDSLGSNVDATNAELAKMIGASVGVLAGRRRKKILSPYESERLFRVAKVIARAEDVFDDLANAFAWLKGPNILLATATPISLLDTGIGAELVTNVLGRIEHGIVA